MSSQRCSPNVAKNVAHGFCTIQIPETDMIYISGLPDSTTEKELAEYFGSIGKVKMDKKTKTNKIWLYRDKVW